MAYGNRSRFQGKSNKGKIDSVSLTGMFATKRDGLHTGRISGEYLDRLIDVIKKAKKEKEPGLTFFLWENDGKKAGDFGLSVGVTKPYTPTEKVRRRPIEPDPDDLDFADEPEKDDDNLFEDD